jgi:predicted SAM-dependent methyltransferase
VNPGLKGAFRQLYLELRVAWATRNASAAFQKFEGQSELKVHLGCGPDVRQGWINIDASLSGRHNEPPNAIYVNHDLRRGLPLPEQSCAFIYSSHLFEHLHEAEGVALMRDCFRALQVGGTFRIVLPDMPRLFQAYIKGDTDFFRLLEEHQLIGECPRSGRAMVDYVNYAVYQFGEHKCLYDFEKLNRTLTKIGFASVTQSNFSAGVDVPSDLRRTYSFYADATKLELL